MVLEWLRNNTRGDVWRGRHVLLTGASEGIGLALAQLFLERHAVVTIVSRSQAKLQAAQEYLTVQRGATPQRLCTRAADVSSFEQVTEAVSQAQAALGPIDVVVANAAVPSSSLFEDLNVEDYDRIFRVNFMGVVHALKATTPGMLKRRRGHIIIVSSLSGFAALPGQSAYSATKFALRGFSDALRIELLGSGVQLSIAYPGTTDTAMLAAMDGPMMAIINQLPAVNLCSPRQVAELMLKGVEQGRYCLLFPDAISAAVTASNGGLAPLSMPWWLAAPVAFCSVLVMQLGYRPMIERAFLKVKAQWQETGPASRKEE